MTTLVGPFELDAGAVRSACYHLAWAVVDDWENSHPISVHAGMSEHHRRCLEVVEAAEGTSMAPWKRRHDGLHCHPAGLVEAAVHLLNLAVADCPDADIPEARQELLAMLADHLAKVAKRMSPPLPEQTEGATP